MGKGPVTFSPNHSRTDVRGADDSPLDVVGVVDATVSAASPTGEHISTPARLYVVDNVTECYLSCDVLRGLRIVNEHFPEPGSGNRHNNERIWNRTGIIVEAKAHGQSLIKLDGSGRLSLRSRQHLKPFHSYLPTLGNQTQPRSHATGETPPSETLPSEPRPSQPELTGGLPSGIPPSQHNSSTESLFFSLEEPTSPEPGSPISRCANPPSSGSETASPPTSSQRGDPRSPPVPHKDAEEAFTKKTRGRPKKTATGRSSGKCGRSGSPQGSNRGQSSSGSRSPQSGTRRSTRPRGPPDRLQVRR